MNLKKTYLTSLLLLLNLIPYFSQAQVKGVGLTLAPFGDRVWWDKDAGLKDGYLWGGQLGFSFGENVELRGLYLQGAGLKRDFSSYGILPEDLSENDVKLTRWGGDLKLNLSRGALMPYLTIGTGVQSTQLGDFDKNQQIYFSGGLGIMLSMGDRATLGLQALRTSYKDNPTATLLTPEEFAASGLPVGEYQNLYNWSGRASLIFYLGGRKPSDLTDVDKAYMNTFSSGLTGISLPIEPIVGKFDWSDKLPYKSTNFGGVATGLDFGPLVGIRAYYLRSFEDKLFSEFDKLEIWGGEGKFKLASSGALIPFLTAGGGKINVLDGYSNPDFVQLPTDTLGIAGRAFASGGGGFDIVLSPHVKLSAFARAMLTSSDKNLIENVNSPDELSTSWLYGASLNLVLGKRAETPKEAYKEENYETRVKADLEKEKKNTRNLKREYQARIDDIEEEIEDEDEDEDWVIERRKEQRKLKRKIAQLDEVLDKEREANGSDYIGMNPSELKRMVNEIKESQKRQDESIKASLEMERLRNEISIERLTKRIERLEENIGKDKSSEKELRDLKKELARMRGEADEEEKPRKRNRDDFEDEDDRPQSRNFREEGKKKLEEEEKSLRKKVKDEEFEYEEVPVRSKKKESNDDKVSKKVKASKEKSEVEEDEDKKKVKTKKKEEDEPQEYRVLGVNGRLENYRDDNPFLEDTTSFFGKFNYEGASGLAGFSLGGNATFNIGLRQHYRYKNTNYFFMPETFFGFGSPASFGIFANGVYQFKKMNTIEPYAGLGVGLMQIGVRGDQKLKAAFNIVFGTNLYSLGNGRFFVDWNARNFFKYNQIALGYRLPF